MRNAESMPNARSTSVTAEPKARSTDVSGTSAAVVRSLVIRKLILLPKMTAASPFQPEDYVSDSKIAYRPSTRLGRLALNVTHTVSVFGCGAVLFVGHEYLLRKLEPKQSHGKPLHLETVDASNSALAGAGGGTLYALCQTSVAAWLATGDHSLRWHQGWKFCRAALPYTIVRDSGGFAAYFGSFTLARQLTELPLAQSAIALNDRMGLDSRAASATELGAAAISIVVSGGLSGLAAYAWRSPFDTLFKIAVGWRSPDTPLWSKQRFLRGPRGLKAVGIGAVTWSVYELVSQALHHFWPMEERPQQSQGQLQQVFSECVHELPTITTRQPKSSQCREEPSAAHRYLSGPASGQMCDLDKS